MEEGSDTSGVMERDKERAVANHRYQLRARGQ